ncbi:MAG: lytic transglycosylase domain-containing protein [Bacteriovoracaceae bacterium]|nr:lytic transglycosylase domain-containing protein [Bacteriovoracaceae bacterium]
MQKNKFIQIIISALIFLASANSFASGGFFVAFDSLSQTFITTKEEVHPGRIQNYIEDQNPNARDYSAMLAENIVEASSCLDLDPIILTALIHKESTFKPDAKSPTGAVGLTQLTSAGIKEIKDQLGYRGLEYTRAENTKYLHLNLQRCMGVQRYKDFLSVMNKDTQYIKRVVQEQTLTSVYMGAILLKVYLAHIKDGNPSEDINSMYQKALELYNGDDNRRAYASRILFYTNNFKLNY